jgi:hypothetical protein
MEACRRADASMDRGLCGTASAWLSRPSITPTTAVRPVHRRCPTSIDERRAFRVGNSEMRASLCHRVLWYTRRPQTVKLGPTGAQGNRVYRQQSKQGSARRSRRFPRRAAEKLKCIASREAHEPFRWPSGFAVSVTSVRILPRFAACSSDCPGVDERVCAGRFVHSNVVAASGERSVSLNQQKPSGAFLCWATGARPRIAGGVGTRHAAAQ